MSEETERRLAAIVSADVVGYSRLIGADEAATLAAMRSHRAEMIDPLIAKHGGRIVKTMGDGLLLEFPSVVNAVKCSIGVQERMFRRNSNVPKDKRIEFRIGINLGDIVIEGDDIHGDGVNVAARLQEVSESGGLALSGIAHESLGSLIDADFEDGGQHQFKNIARPIRTWRWAPHKPSATTSPDLAEKPPALPDKPSIAVLPFDNMSNDPEQEYFSDGITEDIITEISKIPEVMVISRNSTFTYKGKAAKIQDVCRDLGVRYVLEGSVRKAGERVRINAQLIDGRSGGHLWADRYDRSLEDIFAVQDDVTEKIVRALELKLTGGAAAHEAREQTHNPEAYDCVLRGREQYRLFSKDGNAAARELFERAIALDPDYAEPYAGLAETYVQEWFMGSEPTLDRAFELAQQATTRDPTLPLVQEALSTVHLFKRQHAEAIATARRWIELEPSNADAYATLAGAMHFSGENDEVIALIEKAMRLNPFYPFYYPHYIGLANLRMRRFDEAVVALKRGAVRNPEALWPHVFLAVCHGHLGEDAEACDQLTEVRRINPEFSIASLLKLLPYKSSADVDLVVAGLHKAGLST
jgi:adenylate cyclase